MPTFSQGVFSVGNLETASSDSQPFRTLLAAAVQHNAHDLRTPGAAIAMDGGVADTACYTQADHEWAEGTDSANRAAVTC